MAAKTQLHLSAVMGKRYSFSAKDPASSSFQAAWARGHFILFGGGYV